MNITKNLDNTTIGKDIRIWICMRHHDWWEFLIHKLPLPGNFDIREPEVKFHYTRSRWAGRANGAWCKYALPWAFSERENYDGTIAHELCHTFSKRASGFNANHGAFWFYLIRVVCRFKNMCEYNSYNWPKPIHFMKARKLREIDRIKLQLEALSK